MNLHGQISSFNLISRKMSVTRVSLPVVCQVLLRRKSAHGLALLARRGGCWENHGLFMMYLSLGSENQ
jgi:hypothetical protein